MKNGLQKSDWFETPTWALSRKVTLGKPLNHPGALNFSFITPSILLWFQLEILPLSKAYLEPIPKAQVKS